MDSNSWAGFEADAPELAAAVKGRFEASRHHILATVRADGSPRLSGTEVDFGDGELRIGMMADAHKLVDLARDDRVELHSAPLEVDLATGDAKISGSLIPIAPWFDGELDGHAFAMRIRRVSLVRVDGEELEFTVWAPDLPVRTIRRA